MGERFYYDDNIFYLTEIIKNLRDGLRLDISPRLFLDKTVEDLLFVESALTGLYTSLTKNELLIKRAEHLRRLMQAKILFIEILDFITAGEAGISEKLEPFFERFRNLADEQREHTNEIHKILSEAAATLAESTDIVSQEEYRYLLMGEQNSEEPA